MRLLLLISTLMLCLTHSYGQSLKTDLNNDELNLKKLLLISELKPLEARSVKIDDRLGRALAESEIADAAWTLDTTWAKKLLREAYALTFPEEEARSKLVKRAVGA